MINNTTTTQRKKRTYKFEKLSDEAQQAALERMRNWYTDEGWWESVYEDFIRICETIGVEVNEKDIYFSIDSGEDGAKFGADVKLLKLIAGMRDKKYLEVAPLLHEQHRSFTPKASTLDHRVLDLIQRDWIDVTIETDTHRRCYSTKCRMRWNYSYNACVNYNNIDDQMTELEDWVTDIISELDNLLLRMLERECQDRSSNNYIMECIKEQGYRFDKEGALA